MATREEVNDFASFALAQIQRGNAALSIDELYAMWRREHPDPVHHRENVAPRYERPSTTSRPATGGAQPAN